MKFFLTLKHWQLFGLSCVLPIIIQVLSIALLLSNNNPTIIFYTYPIMTLLFMWLFFGWFYVVGTNLYQKLPATTYMNLTVFKIVLFGPIFYLLISFILVFSMFFASLSEGIKHEWIFVMILPVRSFSLLCVFYGVYFTAKALKSVEMQASVTFSDYLGDFLLICIFPIGIWVIQPRINKLFDESDAGEEVVEKVY